MPPLVQLCKNAPDKSVCGYAAGALANLALHEPSRPLIVSEGAVAALVKLCGGGGAASGGACASGVAGNSDATAAAAAAAAAPAPTGPVVDNATQVCSVRESSIT